MSNSVNLSLDVAKTGIQNPLIKVRQGDGGFETLRTTVTSNGEPMDLQGWTITFMGTTAGNHKIVDGNVKLVEAPNGIFDYTPSKAWGMDIGEFKIAYFKFVKGDGSASSANFRVSVIEAVDLTQEEAQNYISVVDTTIATINKQLNDSLANVTQSIADANNNANTVASNVNTLGERVDDYNRKLSAIKVGGRNYILNSSGAGASDTSRPSVKPDYTTSRVLNAAIAYNSDSIALTYTGTAPQEWYYSVAEAYKTYDSAGLDKTKQYTISVDVKGTVPGAVFKINNVLSQSIAINNSTWTRFEYTFNFTDLGGTNSDKFYIRLNAFSGSIYGNFVTGQTLSFRNFKLEEGNVATDWTPALEDAPSNDAQLVHKTGTETIAGNKTFTSPINGSLSGNAATATKWQTARTLALTGDVTGSVAMDGSGNVSIATTGANLVHKTGNESVAGDKTFTGTVNAAQKIYTRTIGSTDDLQIIYTRVGNVVTGRYTVAKSGVFTLSNNDGYKAPTAYAVNVIAQNINAWFTTDNRFSAPDGASQGNFMFITSDPLPAN